MGPVHLPNASQSSGLGQRTMATKHFLCSLSHRLAVQSWPVPEVLSDLKFCSLCVKKKDRVSRVDTPGHADLRS